MSRVHRHRIKKGAWRTTVQAIALCFFNGYTAGFLGKGLYTGRLKLLCVPVLNCYSCPGALGSCPIGAMQTVAAGSRHSFSFYALGTVMLFGVIFGRLLCGILCPFGFLQDLLYKIPLRKLQVPPRADRVLRYLKYAILLIFVILLPAVITNAFGSGEPWFCKLICPAGTLEGGIPQMLQSASLRQLAGALFTWKSALLLAFLIASVRIGRVFCRYFCPLGALYSLFNRFALFQMTLHPYKCTHCGACKSVCLMALDPPQQLGCGECIRCGKCKEICPNDAVSCGFVRTQSDLSEQRREARRNL